MTLIETMISLGILAGGVLVMASVQMKSIQGGQRSRHLGQASVIAESQLEQLQRERWTNIPVTGKWSTPVQVNNNVQSASTEQEQAYALSWRISALTPGKTRAIDVRATWTEADASNRSVTLSSIRNNYEAL